MDESFARQLRVLRRLVSDYRQGMLGLDALVQRIEGICNVLGIEAYNDSLFTIVLSMEQVNAAALDANRRLTEHEQACIDHALREVEALIVRFETDR